MMDKFFDEREKNYWSANKMINNFSTGNRKHIFSCSAIKIFGTKILVTMQSSIVRHNEMKTKSENLKNFLVKWSKIHRGVATMTQRVASSTREAKIFTPKIFAPSRSVSHNYVANFVSKGREQPRTKQLTKSHIIKDTKTKLLTMLSSCRARVKNFHGGAKRCKFFENDEQSRKTQHKNLGGKFLSVDNFSRWSARCKHEVQLDNIVRRPSEEVGEVSEVVRRTFCFSGWPLHGMLSWR